MEFTRNERIAIANQLSTIFSISSNSNESVRSFINCFKAYLSWEEVEEKALEMSQEKSISILQRLSDLKKWHVCVMASTILVADGELSKEERQLLDTLEKLIKAPNVPEGKADEILEDIIETVKNPKPKEQKTAIYYQKSFQEDLELCKYHNEVFDKMIPESAAEMAGALLFCKQHAHSFDLAGSTLRRLVETCDMDYADNPEVQKILPGVKEMIKGWDENAAKKARKDKIVKKIILGLWIVALVAIIVQCIMWGWWTILSGAATLVIAGIIHFIIDINK